MSSFIVEHFKCDDVGNEVKQLGIILYPPELINEKFLIKVRECVLKLSDNHPLKRWLKSLGPSTERNKKQQETILFLSDILNSRFNLITDFDLKNKMINHLLELPVQTLGERLLKSYLYLLIGNVTRSDNILKEFINRAPFENYQGYRGKTSIYHQLVTGNIQQILAKLANHPADRNVYLLFVRYLLSYCNNESLISALNDNKGAALADHLDLKFIERLAPALVHHIKLIKDGETGIKFRLMNLKDYPLHEQVYWHLPYLEADPIVTPDLISELQKVELTNELWFLYLIDSEKLADAYTKKSGKALILGRRQFLNQELNRPANFMMVLYKLIELGNIDESLIEKSIDFLTHE